MLKGISKLITPELLKVLMEMGHGDEIVIGDANFPHASNGKRVLRLDGHNTPEVLDAILALFPLDTFVEKPVSLMAVVEGDETIPKRWDIYRETVKNHFPSFSDFEMVERFDFYRRSKEAYAIVSTGDQALYSCIILKKGVIEETLG